MKFECLVEKLYTAVSKAERFCGKNLSLPILSAIIFYIKKNEILIKSTNLEISFETILNGKIEEEGVWAMPGQTLLSFLSGIDKSKTISLEKKGDKVKILSGEVSAEINLLDGKDFPEIKRIKDEKTLLLKAIEFAKGVKSVSFCTSNSGIKPELSGVYVFNENNNLVFVSTDSFRLAEKKIKIPSVKNNFNFILPSKNALEIARLSEENKGEDVEIIFSKNQIAFSFKNDYVQSRIIDGNFPDYRQIIPKEAKTNISILKDDFLKAIKISSTFSDSYFQIYFKIFPLKKIFEVYTKNSNIGSNNTKLHSALEGDDVEISFNHKYISDCMQVIPEDSISLELNGIGKPMIIRGVPDNTFLYLVMPMNK